ncbi:NACHT domain-containing protein [Jatrophihabitans sp.]|uniref:NACHT domain-containing protein n=1 Tax=Jatrophihabitans sp. TaxID=1932789 RepID=UPI002C7AF3BB|nr:hypothetical protein [Jatrophihabitans sp.]
MLVLGLFAIYYVVNSKDKAAAATVEGGLAAVLLGIATGAPLVVRLIRDQHKQPDERQLVLAMKQLTVQLIDEWTKEAAIRKITTPATVKVSWQWNRDRDHAVPPKALHDLPHGAGPRSIAPNTSPLLTSGTILQLHDLYENIKTGKLVIVGPGGTGKTAALILLLLKELTQPIVEGDKALRPIPFLISVSDWNPFRLSLDEWAAYVLSRDHNYLRSETFGRDAPTALIKTRRVALFLDGLDEMPAEYTAEAIAQIAQQTTLRVVLTSRPEEYDQAVEEQAFVHAAVIRLSPVDAPTAAEYLLRGQTVNRDQWREVSSKLMSGYRPDINKVLCTPLYLSLMREQYRNRTHGNPNEIFDKSRFPTSAAIRGHLLGGIVERAESKPDLTNVRSYMAWLAKEMNIRETRNLPWWRVRQWLPPVPVVLACLLFASAGGITNWVLADPYTGMIWYVGVLMTSLPVTLVLIRPIPISRTYARNLARRSLFAFSLGLSAFGIGILLHVAEGEFRGAAAAPVAVIFGIIGGLGIRMMWYRDRPLRVSAGFPRLTDFCLGLVAGGVGAVITALLGTAAVGSRRAIESAIAVLAIGTVGLALIARITRPDDMPRDRPTPIESFRSDRMGGVLFATIGGTSIALAVAVPIVLTRGFVAGVETGASAGILVATAAMLIVCQSVSLSASAFLDPRKRCPRSLVPYLDKCRDAQILRQVGTTYQFRHADLQDYLAGN